MFNPYSDLSERDQLTKQDILEMWCEDLENYPELQGRGMLESIDGKRCCLGQLCYIGSLYGLCKREIGVSPFGSAILYNGNSEILPFSIQKLVGFKYPNGGYSRGEKTLSADNDSGMSWPEIAKIIRSKPDGMFIESGYDW